MPETVICTCPSDTVTGMSAVLTVVYSRVGIPGYGTRWVGGWGIPVPSTLLEGEVNDSEAGPVSPC